MRAPVPLLIFLPPPTSVTLLPVLLLLLLSLLLVLGVVGDVLAALVHASNAM